MQYRIYCRPRFPARLHKLSVNRDPHLVRKSTFVKPCRQKKCAHSDARYHLTLLGRALLLSHLPDIEITHFMAAFAIFTEETQERSYSAPDAFEYACRSWPLPSLMGSNAQPIFKVFRNCHPLSWLEAQWCSKDLQSCLAVLSEGHLQRNIFLSPQKHLGPGFEFVDFMTVMELHVYTAFTPSKSVLL